MRLGEVGGEVEGEGLELVLLQPLRKCGLGTSRRLVDEVCDRSS